MGMGTLEFFRRLIRSETNLIGEVVENLHGAVPGTLNRLAAPRVASWLVATLPGSTLISLDEFYTIYMGLKERTSTEIRAVDGVMLFKSDKPVIVLARSMVNVPHKQSVPLTVDAGSAASEFGIYVDGKLVRRANNTVTQTLSLDSGKHMIEVVAATSGLVIAVPPTIELLGGKEVPPVPVWASLTPGYADAALGTPANDLRWWADARAGGWRVLKRELSFVGRITSVGDLDANGRFSLTIEGDWSTTIPVGEQLHAHPDTLGTVVAVRAQVTQPVDPDTDDTTPDPTETVVTVALDPSLSQPDPNWIGSLAATGSFTEATTIKRAAASGQVGWLDTSIVVGQAYEYALQAFGVFDPTSLSPLSEVRYIMAGDIDAPSSITFVEGYPKIVNGRVVVRFNTPPEDDYDGVRVYFRAEVQGTLATISGSTVTFDGTPLAGQTLDGEWFITVMDDSNKGEDGLGVADGVTRKVLSYTDNTVISDPPWEGLNSLVPGVGSTMLIYRYVGVVTDRGRPNTVDELTFDSKAYGKGTYLFRTFDFSNNEQDDEVALRWVYDDSTPEEFVGASPPVLTIRQLTAVEQIEFAAPYNDLLRYALVLVDAHSPITGFEGVTLYYQLRGQDVQTMPAITEPLLLGEPVDSVPASPPFVIDDPAGSRSRYIAVARSNNENWLRFWAIDSFGMRSHEMTFVVDFDSTPEIASIESDLDTSIVNQMGTNGVLTVDVVADDDTRSLKFWLENAETNAAVGYTEPTEASPLQIEDTASFGSAFSYAFALGDGWKKVFNVQPYSGPSLTGEAGMIVQRTFSRPPRTDSLFEHRNDQNATTAATVKGTFQVFPAIESEYEGVVSAATVNSVTIATADWTADQWTTVDQNYHFVFMTSGAAKDQVRMIIGNTTTELLLGAAFTPAPAPGDTFQILDGVTYYRYADNPADLTRQLAFQPTYTPIFIPRGDGKTIEFYSVLNGVPAEPVHRILIDPDNSASIGKLTLTKLANGYLQVAIDGLDDDVRYWRSYEKKGGWPSLNGAAITEDKLGVDLIDTHYLRFEGDNSQQSYRHSAGLGVWYVVVVPYNSYNEPGIPRVGSIDLATATEDPDLGDDDPDSDGSDGNGPDTNVGGMPKFDMLTITAADVGTAYANKIKWHHGSGVPEDSTGLFVKVFAWNNLEPKKRIEITEGLSYMPTYDCVPPDNPLTNTVNGEGSILHTGLPERGGPGDQQVTWNYDVWLYTSDNPDPFNFFLVAQYPVGSFTDYYKLPTPHIDSVLLHVVAGRGSLSGCSSQQEVRLTWTDLINPTGESVYFEVFDVVNNHLAASGIAPTATGYTFTESYYYSTAGGNVAQDYQYEVRVKRRSDNAILSSKTTDLRTVQHRQCSSGGGSVVATPV